MPSSTIIYSCFKYYYPLEGGLAWFPYSCICRFCRAKLAPCSANTTHTTVKYLWFPCCLLSVASAAVTAAERSAFWDLFLLHLSNELLAVVSINKMLSCHAHFLLYLNRSSFISDNTLYLSYLSYWAVVCEVSIWLYLS